MSAQAEVLDEVPGVRVADDPQNLAMIANPGCAAAIWQRQPPVGFQTWIDGLAGENLPSARVVLRRGDVSGAIEQICDQARLAEGAFRRWLIADVCDLAARFSDVMRAPYVRLRLDVIETNACRRFHIDAITARLICTYRGTGTQYGVSTDDADPDCVFTLATGSPMVIRGTLWPEIPAAGLLHRSPPIEGTGETRLVLVLDPVMKLEEAV